MDPDLVSFILKFQDICSTGKNATLSFSSSSGKVFANLSVEIGSVKQPPRFSVPGTPSPTLHSRHVSPSRRRRMERRAESRKLFAEEAKHDLSLEERNVLDAAEKAVDNSVSNEVVELTVRDDNKMGRMKFLVKQIRRIQYREQSKRSKSYSR